MSAYPLLWNLFGSYLHQDYDLFAPDPRGAFLAGVREGYADHLPELVAELDRLEAELRGLGEQRGQELLRTLGSEIHIPALGHTPATWIAELAQEVRRLQRT